MVRTFLDSNQNISAAFASQILFIVHGNGSRTGVLAREVVRSSFSTCNLQIVLGFQPLSSVLGILCSPLLRDFGVVGQCKTLDPDTHISKALSCHLPSLLVCRYQFTGSLRLQS